MLIHTANAVSDCFRGCAALGLIYGGDSRRAITPAKFLSLLLLMLSLPHAFGQVLLRRASSFTRDFGGIGIRIPSCAASSKSHRRPWSSSRRT